MVVLPNLYTSDMKDMLDWWNAHKAGCIPATLSTRVENIMERLDRDLHDIARGKNS